LPHLGQNFIFEKPDLMIGAKQFVQKKHLLNRNIETPPKKKVKNNFIHRLSNKLTPMLQKLGKILRYISIKTIFNNLFFISYLIFKFKVIKIE